MPFMIPLLPVTPTREIFILAGQSNMSGRGLLSAVPPNVDVRRVKNYNSSGVWVPATEPLHLGIDPDAAVGPGLFFGADLAAYRPYHEIGLVPCAVGGTGIAQWARSSSPSSLYGAMINRAKAAATSGRLAGVLWYQGENDTQNSTDANAYAALQAALIANVRLDLELPELPFIVTELGPKPATGYSSWTIVQAAQSGVTGVETAVVSAADLTVNPDGLHLNTASQVILGQRYALEMAAMLQ